MKKAKLVLLLVCLTLSVRGQQTDATAIKKEMSIDELEKSFRQKDSLLLEKSKPRWIANAKKINLSDEKINKVIEVVEQRYRSLYKAEKESQVISKKTNRKKHSNSKLRKAIAKVKQDYSKSISALVTRKEYNAIFMEEIGSKANKKAKKQLKVILKTKELTDEQQDKLFVTMIDYYMNKINATEYYAHDIAERNKVYAILNYYYEKNYHHLMKGFGFDVKHTKKPTRKGYVW